jgi:hypothetical protein
MTVHKVESKTTYLKVKALCGIAGADVNYFFM